MIGLRHLWPKRQETLERFMWCPSCPFAGDDVVQGVRPGTAEYTAMHNGWHMAHDAWWRGFRNWVLTSFEPARLVALRKHVLAIGEPKDQCRNRNRRGV